MKNKNINNTVINAAREAGWIATIHTAQTKLARLQRKAALSAGVSKEHLDTKAAKVAIAIISPLIILAIIWMSPMPLGTKKRVREHLRQVLSVQLALALGEKYSAIFGGFTAISAEIAHAKFGAEDYEGEEGEGEEGESSSDD